MSHGYEYGNARLRARYDTLLGRADFFRLADRDVDGMLALLSRTAWRGAIEEASTRFSGIRCVHEAARRHLARALRDVRPLYEAPASEQVEALLAVWDRRNLVTILRAAAKGRPSDEATALVVPAGLLDEAALRTLAAAGDPKGVIDLLVMWGVPPGRALLGAWPAYHPRGDVAVLERALLASYAADFEARDLDPVVADALGAELARDEVLLAVRLRAARESGEELVASPEWIADQDLPGGSLRPEDLWDFVRLPARAQAVGIVLGRPGLMKWEALLSRWATTGDVEELADDLDRDLHRRRTAARYRSDPLGPGPIIAYVAALEAEAHNVRAIAAGRVAGLDPDAIRSYVWEI